MRKGRFTEDQIIKVLKEHAAGMSASDLCRKHGISDATFYKWRSRYGGMDGLRRRAVTWAIDQKGYSQRRACKLVGLQPKTYRYASTRPDDGALRARLKELA
jgi:putative transposase